MYKYTQSRCVFLHGHAAQVQQGQGGAAAGGGDLQAQWADYYRQLGYFYSGQQQSSSAGATGQPPNPGGTNGGPATAGPGGSDGEHKVSVMIPLLVVLLENCIRYYCVHFSPFSVRQSVFILAVKVAAFCYWTIFCVEYYHTLVILDYM